MLCSEFSFRFLSIGLEVAEPTDPKSQQAIENAAGFRRFSNTVPDQTPDSARNDCFGSSICSWRRRTPPAMQVSRPKLGHASTAPAPFFTECEILFSGNPGWISEISPKNRFLQSRKNRAQQWRSRLEGMAQENPPPRQHPFER